MRSTTLLSIFSIVILGACVSVQRPNAIVYGVNGGANPPRLEGFNVKTDYDSNGARKPDAELKYRALPNGIKSMNGAICFMPPLGEDEGIKGIKRWLTETRLWAKEHCQ
jgi:hypothetical protein